MGKWTHVLAAVGSAVFLAGASGQCTEAEHLLHIERDASLPLGDSLGYQIHADGEWVMATHFHGDADSLEPTASLYRWNGHALEFVQALYPPNQNVGRNYAVLGAALDGEWIAFGAHSAGEVHVYRWDGQLWSLHQTLAGGGLFGLCIDIDGERMVIGADEKVVVFTLADSGEWDRLQAVSPQGDLTARSTFGRALALAGDRLLVGAPDCNYLNFRSGVVHAYQFTGQVFHPAGLVHPPTLPNQARFGASIALDGSRMIVGAPLAPAQGVPAGAVYGFEWDGGAWEFLSRVTPADRQDWQQFGAQVELDGETVYVASSEWTDELDSGVAHGAVYVYTLADAVWTEHAKVRDDMLERGDRFGEAIEVHDGQLYTKSREGGGFLHNDDEVDVYSLCGCVADFNDDDDVNTQDVLAFLNAWTAGDGAADVNDDGTVDSRDVLDFLNLWNTGCP